MKNTKQIKTAKHMEFLERLINEIVVKERLDVKALVEVNTNYIKVLR